MLWSHERVLGRSEPSRLHTNTHTDERSLVWWCSGSPSGSDSDHKQGGRPTSGRALVSVSVHVWWGVPPHPPNSQRRVWVMEDGKGADVRLENKCITRPCSCQPSSFPNSKEQAGVKNSDGDVWCTPSSHTHSLPFPLLQGGAYLLWNACVIVKVTYRLFFLEGV